MDKQGMTLVEILITVSILGLLAAIIVPSVNKSIERRQNAITASHIRIAVNAFELYRSEIGEYPPDSYPSIVPPEMVDYFNSLGIDWWTQKNDVGGRWDWDNGYHFAYSVSISQPTASTAQLKELDLLLGDDGDLSTGTFRRVGGQYHYILEN